MATVALLGASGYTGRLTARALDRAGTPFIAAGRDVAKVRAAVEGLANVKDVRAIDVDDSSAVDSLCADVDVLITTVGPFDRLGRGVLASAAAHGTHYVDSTGEQPFVRWAIDEVDADARASAATAIPACGFDYVPGDLLAAIAAQGMHEPREVHVAYLVNGPGGPIGWTSKGTRTTIATLLDAPVLAYVDAALVEEKMAQERRLAWFPKPVGPRHAAGYAGAECLTVPRHLPTVRTVRTYMALPSLAAEVTQIGGTLLRLGPVRKVAEWFLLRGPEGPDDRRRAATRWACVAEVADADGSVSRAWAYGTDVYGFTGVTLATAAGWLADGRAQTTGVASPALAFDPVEFIDALAAASDLRWSVKRPS